MYLNFRAKKMVWHENSNFLVLKNQINLTKMLFNKVSNIFGTKIQIQKNRISGQKQDNYSSVQFSGSCHWRDFFFLFWRLEKIWLVGGLGFILGWFQYDDVFQMLQHWGSRALLLLPRCMKINTEKKIVILS